MSHYGAFCAPRGWSREACSAKTGAFSTSLHVQHWGIRALQGPVLTGVGPLRGPGKSFLHPFPSGVTGESCPVPWFFRGLPHSGSPSWGGLGCPGPTHQGQGSPIQSRMNPRDAAPPPEGTAPRSRHSTVAPNSESVRTSHQTRLRSWIGPPLKGCRGTNLGSTRCPRPGSQRERYQVSRRARQSRIRP